MKAFVIALAALIGSVFASPCLEGDYVEKMRCEQNLKAALAEAEALDSPPTRLDTAITISIHGTDTTKTLTIRRVDNWKGSQEDLNRFVNTFTAFGVLSLLGSVVTVFAVLNQ